ncbi:hypothetical protein B0O99DRAFT_185628 [Bisporella sp. PMI_857]|nr:hypothetical protein B0O99DRAFT_185628 [Bisporella sp. PMI_857]
MALQDLKLQAHPHSWGHPKRWNKTPIPNTILVLISIILVLQFVTIPRYLYREKPHALALSQHHAEVLDAGLRRCEVLHSKPAEYPVTDQTRANPRWNKITGQQNTVVLRNATLFNGESFIGARDITFKNGIVISVGEAKLGPHLTDSSDAEIVDLAGKYVTPGLVDMHSHHLAGTWPILPASSEENEIHESTGPLTPMLRVLDSMKADDLATAQIAAGGVTSSLVLPGSGNIMGGQGFMVKNVVRGEEVVADLLLESGIEETQRRRYMKMACGENPARLYGHTRMGDAWIFRHQLEKARNLLNKQDEWCLSAAAAKESGNDDKIAALGSLPEELELESSIALLRGQIGLNIHCYEPEDFEDILRHSKEFGFTIQAFHHAIAAWKVPEMIKEGGENITVATFANFGLYKKEAYDANLWAGKILAEHGVPVAYKSDHFTEETSSRYLLFQAATAASFDLPLDLAMQSVTSVPARSLRLDHRIGYVRPGYDADIVVWDSHPLSLGATPLQVYIDGVPTLSALQVNESFSSIRTSSHDLAPEPHAHSPLSPREKEEACQKIEQGQVVITGITTSYLRSTSPLSSENLTLVLTNGSLACLSTSQNCNSYVASSAAHINLQDGHLSPGLTTISALGLSEIMMEPSTGDGDVSDKVDPIDPSNVVFAKYGVQLEGKGFVRARWGGVSRSIAIPNSMEGTFLHGVSAGIKTHGKEGLLDGGVFKEEVAVHFVLGQQNAESISTVSTSVAKLRKIIADNNGKDNVYGRVANGSIPLVVKAQNKYVILQLIHISRDFPAVNLVLYGGAEAPLVATELAASGLPLILTSPRPAPDSWEKSGIASLTGPPLSRSPIAILLSAGISPSKLALAFNGNPPEGISTIHNTALEAGWAAKFAALSDEEAIALVSYNINAFLNLTAAPGPSAANKEDGKGQAKGEDIILWTRRPLEFGASVVLSIDGESGRVVGCWPEVM